MKLLTFPTVVTVLSVLTAVVSGYSLGPRLFGWPRPMVVYSPIKMLEKQLAIMNRAFDAPLMKTTTTSSPRYEITDDEHKFQIAVDVPGMKTEDVHINVEEAGSILTISGHRESTNDTYSFKSQFSQSFSLDPAVDSEKFTANLKDGVLIVSAPKDMKRIEQNVRKIPITELALPRSEDKVKMQVKEENVKKEEAVVVEHK
jgi:HSP20 family protein